ncbi:carbohydrate ABC transporter permease [Qingrenia yutianensis]|uniref:Sugar ABC transporter permease n=1 Tax=Qingrenia yutianensis TaxID=2763676 RepID=A0A926IMG8_9FIRM|nr:sugar ABC transporter permease [Qingrenia yutianensis]MBC8596022.1 sugar ABC transporter permease [Qingrenia yutianensis]
MKTTMNMRSGVKIKSGRLSDSAQCYLLLGLPLIGFFVFTLYPILWAMRLSFFYHDGIPSNTVFVGIENFVNAFKDKVYWGTWLTTLQFAVMKLPIELPLALVLAVLLNKKIKGSGFFRTVYFMPTVISAALIALMFSNLFSVFGIVNMYLIKLGIIKDFLTGLKQNPPQCGCWLFRRYGIPSVQTFCIFSAHCKTCPRTATRRRK